MPSDNKNKNVYVGHRYVPKIFGVWDKLKTYEGLSIVTWEGTSYTSKKRVPEGVDILNEEYWVVTGNYNAQVESYRQEVRDMQDEVDSKVGQDEFDDSLNSVNQQLAELVSHRVNKNMSSEDIQTVINRGGLIEFDEGEYNLEFTGSIENHLGTIPFVFDIPSDTKIIMKSETILKVPANDSRLYALFMVNDRERVIITGGRLQGDRTEHTGTTGEWGHGIQIRGSYNVLIDGVEAFDFWGDGIDVENKGEQITGNESRNVVIRNCLLYNNRRQGISVTSLDGGSIENCVIYDTNGTAPECGIDIEPNIHQSVKNLTVSNNHIFNNEGDGIRTIVLKGVSIDNIKIINNTIHDNTLQGIVVQSGATGEETPTNIIVESNTVYNCSNGISFEDNNNTGINTKSNISNNIVYNITNFGIRNYRTIGLSITDNKLFNIEVFGGVIDRGIDFIFKGNSIKEIGRSGLNMDGVASNGIVSDNLIVDVSLDGTDNDGHIFCSNGFTGELNVSIINNTLINNVHEVRNGIHVFNRTNVSNLFITNNSISGEIERAIVFDSSVNVSLGAGNYIKGEYNTKYINRENGQEVTQ